MNILLVLLALCTFLLSLSNLWLWIKVYKLENKTEHDTIMRFIKWVQEYTKDINEVEE